MKNTLRITLVTLMSLLLISCGGGGGSGGSDRVAPCAAGPVHGLLGGAGGSWFNCSAGLSGGFAARLGDFAAASVGSPGGWDGWDAGHVACYYGVVRGTVA